MHLAPGISLTYACSSPSIAAIALLHSQFLLLMTPSIFSNSPGLPLHNLRAGEGQASSWEQALYALTLVRSVDIH